jgi:exopolyphosphatase/pppGpp-phosphohydrolase
VLKGTENDRLGSLYGVVEIGSRAVRLLVVRISPDGQFNVIATSGKETQLGEYVPMADPRMIETLQRTSTIVEQFLRRCTELRVNEVKLFGTEALRRLDPDSQQKLADQFPSLVVLTEREEAYMSLLAAVKGLSSVLTPSSNVLSIDAGGRSIECAYGRVTGNVVRLVDFKSYPLGTQILIKTLHEERGDISKLKTYIEGTIDKYGTVKLDMERPPTIIVLGSAGTKVAWYLIKSTQRLQEKSYTPRLVHGQWIDSRLLARFLEYAKRNPDILALVPTDRDPEGYREVQTVLGGIVALSGFLKRYASNEFLVSAWGLRYGVAWCMAFKEQCLSA